jgi:nitrogen fixation protein FixH
MSATPTPPFQLTGRHVLAGVTLFFLVVISVDVLFAVLAYRTFSGQAAKNPYEAGLLYNQTLEERRAQAMLGWTAEISTAGGELAITLSDPAGRPLDDLSLQATLTRPATEAGRLAIKPRFVGQGRYVADIAGLAGAWDVAATAKDGQDRRFTFEQRIALP